MQPTLITQLSQTDLDQIVKLHQTELKESFINNFGSGFLAVVYKTIISDNQNIFLTIKDNTKVVGFLVATVDGDKFNQKIINNNFLKLSCQIIKSSLFKPLILIKLINWFLTKNIKNKLAPELQFIAIDHTHQGKGLGTMLIKQLNNEFKKRGINKYRVGTKALNVLSNNFYKKLDFKYTHQEQFFGDIFNYYLSPIL